MKKKRTAWGFRTLLAILSLIILALSCRKEKTGDMGLTPYYFNVPKGFPPIEVPGDNQPYQERIALGRQLYYDPILSQNGLSCASCHWQSKGFTSPAQGMPVLPHVNMAWKSVFMWDGREQGGLEDVMQFEVEEFFGTDIGKLDQHPEYPGLFEEAYGVQTINSRDVAKALAQFARTMISSDSKYDRVQRSLASFTTEEAKGLALFNSEKGSCYHCHTPPLFTDNGLHNTGLEADFSNPEDRGYFAVSQDSMDLGRMRTPTLRNVSLRDRFMHDGRFSTLREVVEHYNTGVQHSPSLDPVMIKGDGTVNLKLSSEEVDQIVAFLLTLTDSIYIHNNQLSKP